MRIDILSLCVAFLALIRPYLETLYNKKFKLGRITFYPTGRVELGFSDFGPTLGIYGTLRISDNDAFVTHVECRVKNLKDKSERQFEWLAIRPFTLNFGNAPLSLELPAGFNLVKSQPYKIGLTLCDRTSQSELGPILDNVAASYKEHLKNTFEDAFESLPERERSDSAELSKVIFNWYASTEQAQKSLSLLERKQVWGPGDYKLEIIVHRATGGSPDRTELFFSLKESDENLLLSNAEVLLAGACGNYERTYSFAHSEYRSSLQ